MEKARILGIDVDLIDHNQLIKEITLMPVNDVKIIGNANIKSLNLAYDEIEYRNFLKKCDTIFCDGVGVIYAAKLLGYKMTLANRMTCPDYLDLLIKEIITKGLSIYFLAGKQSTIRKLNEKLAKKHPNLTYRAHHGHFEKTGSENSAVIRDINNFRPDILFIGFGMPLQEYWLSNNIHEIDAKVLLPLGACLDFYTGEVYRGPKWLTNNGFEWLSRLFTEPMRLWRRYLIGNPLFFLRIIIQKLKV